MSGRRAPVLKVRIDKGRRLATVSGWRAREVCELAGARPIWNARRRGWMVDVSRVADVVAAGEHERRLVDVCEVAA